MTRRMMTWIKPDVPWSVRTETGERRSGASSLQLAVLPVATA